MVHLASTLLVFAVCFMQHPSEQQRDSGAQPSSAPDNVNIDPAMQADLRTLFADVGMDDLLRLQIDQNLKPLAAMLKANPQLTPEFVDEYLKRAKESLLDGRIQNLAFEEYAKFFTREEIQQMIAYQESPVGRKAKQVMPQMMSELGTRVGNMSQRLGKEIANEVAREHPEYIKKSDSSATAGGVVGGVIGAAPSSASMPDTKNSDGQRVDADTEEARLVRKVEPEYPPLAKAARVQGIVKFTAVIGTDGKVKSLSLISGHPLLINAARQAVLQWEYEPLVMAGTPVKVLTQVQVDFHLNSAE